MSALNIASRVWPAGKKPYSCHHCDHTADASLLRTHLHKQHQDFLGLYGKQGGVLDEGRHNGPKASRYMDYLRSRSALLSQPCWNPYTSLPEAAVVANGGEAKAQGSNGDATGSVLNLSLPDTGEAASRGGATEALVRHQCPYCGHASSYPEVLWIHQRVAHKVDGGSSVAPKWAPSATVPKGLKGGGTQWRRTGPPPFLEGKDCPALHTPRTLRTQPPDGTSSTTSSSGIKHSAPKAQSAPSKPKHQSKDSRSSSSSSSSEGKTGALPQKKSAEKKQSEESGIKSCGSQASSSSSSSGAKNPAAFQPSSSPKYHRPAAVEANFPQEGLGFMLGRSRGGTSAAAADRGHFRRQSCDGSSGADLWAAMNMWGHKAYLEHLHFAQGKTGTSGEMPVDIDIVGLLKNYNPHDLAALYQHWGFVDPRIDPQGEAIRFITCTCCP